MTTGDKAELLPVGYVCANNGSGGLQVCDKNATGAMPIYASDLERRAPSPPSEVVERVAEWLSTKYGSDLPLSEKAPDRQREWRADATALVKAAGVSGVPEGKTTRVKATYVFDNETRHAEFDLPVSWLTAPER